MRCSILDDEPTIVEAARRRDLTPHIVVVLDKSTMRITDYSGGFDPKLIKYGSSSKAGSGHHGIFLASITDPSLAGVLGFTVNFHPFPGGTTTVIKFNQVC